MVEVAQAGFAGHLDGAVDRGLAEVDDQVRLGGAGGFLRPDAVEHRVGEALRELDRPDRVEGFRGGADEERDLAADHAAVGEGRRGELLDAPVGDRPRLAPVAAVALNHAPERRAPRRVAPEELVFLERVGEVGVDARVVRREIRLDVALLAGKPAERLVIERLDADGHAPVAHDPDDLADGLADRGRVRPPDDQLDALDGRNLDELQNEVRRFGLHGNRRVRVPSFE